MIIFIPTDKLLLQEAVALPTNTDLYHFTKSGLLNNNRDDYIFVTKEPVKYAPMVVGVFGTGDDKVQVYHFKSETSLRLPTLTDQKLITSTKSYLAQIIKDKKTKLIKSEWFKDIKNCWEEPGNSMQFKMLITLPYLAKHTDFPEKLKIDGFQDTADRKIYNYCLFRWHNKLRIINHISYKQFKRQNPDTD